MKSATMQEINRKAEEAWQAFVVYRNTTPTIRSGFLRALGVTIDKNREQLITVASRETSLALERLDGEVDRTVNQCYLFADLLLEGSWVRAIIDEAMPQRKPVPRPDLRQMQIAIGPVAVFGASNFPFAYSVCGGDTIAALAAGCPVVYKVNPGHPETSEVVSNLVLAVQRDHNLPAGTFSSVNGDGIEPGVQLVMHPRIKAVGFTGSLKAGRSLFDAAAKRDEPIPVYAEMGSTNPVFILPEILEQQGAALAQKLFDSNTSSAGQFCTNPGIMITNKNAAGKKFITEFASLIEKSQEQPMLNTSVFNNFNKSVDVIKSKDNITLLSSSEKKSNNKTGAFVFQTSSENFLADRELWEEMFGPASIQVSAGNVEEMMKIAEVFPGQITASVWGTDDDLKKYRSLTDLLQLKAGRIVINGVPTGVEVSPAMNHGGPYPATTDSKFTSVGTQSIYRFTRPICFQNYPHYLLPAELHDGNPCGIWRMVNGKITASR